MAVTVGTIVDASLVSCARARLTAARFLAISDAHVRAPHFASRTTLTIRRAYAHLASEAV